MLLLWLKLMVIFANISPYGSSSNGQDCIPVLKHRPSCDELFYCVGANTTDFRIPVVGDIRFALIGDCKALEKEPPSEVFTMKVLMTSTLLPNPDNEKGAYKLIRSDGEYTGHWQGAFTKLNLIKAVKSISVFIYLQKAADGTVALPTYSIYSGCQIKKLPPGCW